MITKREHDILEHFLGCNNTPLSAICNTTCGVTDDEAKALARRGLLNHSQNYGYPWRDEVVWSITSAGILELNLYEKGIRK